MFTLKWIAVNGAEMIYPARDVVYNPPDQIAPALSASTHNPEPVRMLIARDIRRPCVSFYQIGYGDQNGDVHCTIDTGRVYVMNANGRTVADYHLSSVAQMTEGVAAAA